MLNDLDMPLASELAAQPRPGQTKIMAHHVDRSTDGDGRLIGRHAAEIVHLDDLGQCAILSRQGVQGVVQLKQLHPLRDAIGLHFNVGIPWNACFASATLGRADRAGVVDQYLPHHARHEREEVSPVGKLWLAVFEQLDERFVDERGRLERMTRRLPPHERPRDSVQLAIDERQQLVERGLFSVAQPVEERRDR